MLPKTLHAHVTEDDYEWYKGLSAKDELPIAAHVRRALKNYRKRIEHTEAGEDRRRSRSHAQIFDTVDFDTLDSHPRARTRT
jgi:hypothetical protein